MGACEGVGPNYCPSEGDWPTTYPGRSATIACATGYRGMRSRQCSEDAYWEEVDESACCGSVWAC